MLSTTLRWAVCLLLAFTGGASAQTLQTIYSFNDTQGREPAGTLVLGPDGGLYGTATQGGASGAGTAFKISTDGVFTLLGNFDQATTGRLPYGRMVNIGDGFLYGVSEFNTGVAGDPLGTVFRLSPAGGEGTAGGLSVVFQFPSIGTGPGRPRALVSGVANTLHALGSSFGGIWRIPLGPGTPDNVFNFANENGYFPYHLIRGQDGLLYGGTLGTSFVGTDPNVRGTLFRIAPDGTGFTKLHDCVAATGTTPTGAMVQDAQGNFYGTMQGGGQFQYGSIFKLTPAGAYTVLRSFASNDLHAPTGDLLLASDGQLYGTASAGGTTTYGGLFRIKTDGSGYKMLHTFNKTNGATPYGGLTQALDGNIYGVTAFGGATNQGTVFRLKITLPPVVVNRPPVAVNDRAVVMNAAVSVPVLGNDFDPDDDALVVTIETPPTKGSAEIQPNGEIVYTPGVDFAGEDTFTYRITDPDGLFATATVDLSSTPAEALVQPGVYNGLLALDPQLTGEGTLPRAQFILNVQSSGKFTGKLFTQKKRLALKGTFDASASALLRVKLPGKGTALLYLSFIPGESGSLLAVLFGQEYWTGVGRPLAAGPAAREDYTVVVGANGVESPLGSGFGIMRILPSGIVAIAGKLGDGTPLAWGTTLVYLADGTVAIPAFSEPLKGGVCGGLLLSDPGTPGNFLGSVRWIRPPASKPTKPFALGFDRDRNVLASRYAVAASPVTVLDTFATNNAALVFADGVNTTPQTILGVAGKKFTFALPVRSFTVNRKTGLFSGKVKMGAKTVNYQGVVNQALQGGAGYFLLNGETGAVEITVPDR